MGEKHSKQPSTPKSDQPTVEVCDICGDVGDLELILICPECKISREHVYCRKVLTLNILDEWCCDTCGGGRLGSLENVNQDPHNTLTSNPSGYVCDEGLHSAIKGKHQVVEKIVNKGKVKCITSKEAMMLSSGTKRGETISKTKRFNSSPMRIGRPMCPRTPVHQNGLPSKSPVMSVPLPDNKRNNSVIQRQESRKSHIPKANPAVETKLGSSGKDKSMPRETSIARSLENQFQQPINSVTDTHVVETKFSSMRKETNVPKETSCAPSLKKQFIQPSTSVVDTKVASTGKKTGMSIEGSCAPSLGQYQQQSISVTPAVETKAARMRKEESVPKEASCSPSQKEQFRQPSTSVMAVETKVASTRKDASMPIEGSCALSLEHYLQQSASGHQISGDLDPRLSDLENCLLMNVEPKAEKFSRGPALDSLWKGRFKILGKSFQNFNSQFEARPSCRASRKVLDCSKRMPQVLQFSLIHRKVIWRTVFKDDCPDEDDIGLYFCSGDNDKGSNYDWVLTFIEALDLALRCDISGMELYLFTSKALSADHQTWNGEHFLWGLLRKIGKHKDVSKLYEELPPVVHQPSDSSRNNDIDHDEDCAVDMEIDMLAGNDVGKTDIAVPRDSFCLANSSVGHVKSFPLQEMKQEMKKEPLLDCPPGFEEMYRLKVQKIDFS